MLRANNRGLDRVVSAQNGGRKPVRATMELVIISVVISSLRTLTRQGVQEYALCT